MAAIKLIITDVGRAEVLNAAQNGFAPVTIAEVGYGSSKYTASHSQTSLQQEFLRLSTISGGAISPSQIHVTARDSSHVTEYSVYEVGVYLSTGTLFAVYSQTTAIIEKAAPTEIQLAVDIELTGDVTPDMITFGDTNFFLNSATEDVEGTVQLATSAEVVAGTDATKAVTPKGVKAAIDAVDLSEYAQQGVLPTDSLASKDAGLYSTLTGGTARLYAVLPTLTSGGQTQRIALSLVDEDDQGSQVAKLISSTDNWATVTPTLTFLTRSAGDDYYTQRANNLQDLDDHAAARSNLGVARATQAEAEAGALDNVTMSPLRTKEAIEAQRPFATQAEATALTGETQIMSPLRVKDGVLAMRASPGEAAAGTSNTVLMTPSRTALYVNSIPERITYAGETTTGAVVEYADGRYEEWGWTSASAPTPASGEIVKQIELNQNIETSRFTIQVTPRHNPHARIVKSTALISQRYVDITLSKPMDGDGDASVTFQWHVSGYWKAPTP